MNIIGKMGEIVGDQKEKRRAGWKEVVSYH
jgi:hypothetical protein